MEKITNYLKFRTDEPSLFFAKKKETRKKRFHDEHAQTKGKVN